MSYRENWFEVPVRWAWFFFVLPGTVVWIFVGLLFRCVCPGWQVFPELRGWVKVVVVFLIVSLSALLWTAAIQLVWKTVQ